MTEYKLIIGNKSIVSDKIHLYLHPHLTLFRIQNIKLSPQSGINPGYEKKGRALSYDITQDYIVDKKDFLDKAIEKIIEKYSSPQKLNSIRILEPGCGPGKITTFYLLGKKMLQSFRRIDIECADLSDEMALLVNKYLKERENEIINSNCNVNVRITSGTCLIDASYYENIAKKPFDVVLLSQFKHYFPNSYESQLANKLRKNNIPFMAKDHFIQLVYDSLMKPNSMLIIINDEEHEDANVRKLHDDNWDKYTAMGLTKNIDKISALSREIADKIYKKYHTLGIKPEDVAGEIRRYRREQCNEEIRPLSATISSLKRIFGDENVEYFRHKDKLLGRFYLAIAYKL